MSTLPTASKKGEETSAFWLLCLPAVVIYLFIMAFPTLSALVISMTNYTGGALFDPHSGVKFVGGFHYAKLLTDEFFYLALQNNFAIVGVSVFGQIPLGFILAYILYRRLVVFPGFWQTILYVPVVISPIVIGLLWQIIFHPLNGPVTKIGQFFIPGWENNLMLDKNFAMYPIMFVTLWQWTGMYLLMFLANLQRIDGSIIEAARIDGASEGQILVRIILPALSGVIVIAAIQAIAGSMQTFNLIYAMTGGGPARHTSVLAFYMYEMAFQGSPDYGLANAISMVIIVISIAMIVLTQGIEKKFGGKDR